MHWNTFKTTQFAGYLFIILSIINWSGNFVASRGMADMGSPGALNLLRWGLATVLFAPFGIRALWRERAEVLRLFMPLSVIALSGISLFDTLIFLAGHTSEALNMSLISTLSPLLTALTAQCFLRQRFHGRMYVGIAVSFLGVCLLVTNGNLLRLGSMEFAAGDIIILATALMSAIYNHTIKLVADRISQATLLMASCLLGTIYLVPVVLWEGGGSFNLPDMTSTLIWSLLYLAIFASLLCYLLWNMAVQVLGATKTAMFYYTLPPVSGFAAWVVLGEPVGMDQLLSGAIILAGILIALYAEKPKWLKVRLATHEQLAENAE
ncbi:DMT family transporter [Desulfovibrio mangrovi]|uniref:DMT family transporter n=1 Tax=Desulfovibrio mangrovi TaxID=2976983 RepID=UPI0022454352|nr:DMT family transporter [Desulfovibrio mangrovi]UZP66621.1 DMT family transporter [Desulfovibrio mangrovi]